MYQTTTMNKNLITEYAPITIKSEAKKKIARTFVAVLCLLGLAAAFFTSPIVILMGLAGFCVLAAMAFHVTFLIAMLQPRPKK
jgi:Na+/proline symporter